MSADSPNTPVKLRAVAEKAGVSIATVSRVLNSDPAVKSDTRLAVQNAIKSTGYKPNRVAQRLRSTAPNRKLIGLLIPDIQNPFYVDVISGIEEIAYQNGSAVVIGNFSQDPARERMYIDILRSESVDGFIVAPTNSSDPYVEELIRQGNSVICIDRGLSNISADIVKSDNEKGAFNATEHLIKLGHTRIAHIHGDISIKTTHERIDGYKAALAQYGVVEDSLLLRGRQSNFQSGVDITNELLALPEPPTAIFTGNNLLTLGSLEALHSHQVEIPGQVAVVGFDDMYWATSLNPSLTAIRQHGVEIGRKAIELLYSRISDPDRAPATFIIKTDLVIRKSCGFK